MKSVRPLERWAYFLRHADRYSAAELRDILSEAAFTEAIGVLEMIARNPEQRLAYDARLKFQRDEAARLEFARLEGERIGREQGQVVGREEGALIGKIQLLEELLFLPPSDEQSLAAMDQEKLAARVEALQRQLRERPA
jgi:hypothetical protein